MSSRAKVTDFKPHREGLRQILGDLEADIMEHVWSKGQCTVRDVHNHLLDSRELAYTTVMTVMSRLCDKEILRRETNGTSYMYMPVMEREQYLTRVVGEVLDALLSSHRERTLSQLAGRLHEAEAHRLDRLAAMLAAKREGR
jgi:predicted transcriptional regulator